MRLIILGCLWLAAGGPGPAGAAVELDHIQQLVDNNDLTGARARIDEFLYIASDTRQRQEALYYRGLTYLYQNRPQSAQEVFGQILTAQPYGVLAERVRLSQIDVLLMEGDYPRALAEAERLAQDYPESKLQSVNLLNMARAQLRLAYWMDARRDLERLVRDFSDSPEAHIAHQLLQERQYFTVQVGSFVDRRRAEEEAGRLIAQGEQAYVFDITDRSGVKYYRVRLGRFRQLDQAQVLKRRLTALGYPARIYP